MSATNSTGSTYGQRQGSFEVIHTYPVAYNTTGISSAVLVDTIQASTSKPVIVNVQCSVNTAFNAGTTNVLTVGTSTTANEWLAAGDINEAVAGFYPASNAVTKFRLTADTKIYVKYTQTGTAATTGAATVIISTITENTKTIA
jgi:hypothetical protein